MNHQFDPNADPTLLPDAVRKGIREADPPDVGPRNWQTVSLAFRDPQAQIIAGLYGATMWSWLMIDGLWVAPQFRKQGLARQLLRAAEQLAIERGCIGAWLGTFDFQAKTFYEKNGYQVFAQLPGFPPSHTHYHLQKQFAPKNS